MTLWCLWYYIVVKCSASEQSNESSSTPANVHVLGVVSSKDVQ